MANVPQLLLFPAAAPDLQGVHPGVAAQGAQRWRRPAVQGQLAQLCAWGGEILEGALGDLGWSSSVHPETPGNQGPGLIMVAMTALERGQVVRRWEGMTWLSTEAAAAAVRVFAADWLEGGVAWCSGIRADGLPVRARRPAAWRKRS